MQASSLLNHTSGKQERIKQSQLSRFESQRVASDFFSQLFGSCTRKSLKSATASATAFSRGATVYGNGWWRKLRKPSIILFRGLLLDPYRRPPIQASHGRQLLLCGLSRSRLCELQRKAQHRRGYGCGVSEGFERNREFARQDRDAIAR